MRIISGSLGGRIVKTVPGEGMRPAMQRTREALFSLLEADGLQYPGLKVLDLFAGSGSLAFECISRGAEFAELVENGSKIVKNISANMAELNIRDKCHVTEMDARKFLKIRKCQPFDLVFIDPPYRLKIIQTMLTGLLVRDWLENGAYIVAELEKGEQPETPAGLRKLAERLFGQTCLHVWRYEKVDKVEMDRQTFNNESGEEHA